MYLVQVSLMGAVIFVATCKTLRIAWYRMNTLEYGSPLKIFLLLM